MADYYTKFSVILEMGSAEAAAGAMQLLQSGTAQADPGRQPIEIVAILKQCDAESWDFAFELEKDHKIWLHGSEGNSQTAYCLIQLLLQKFEFADFVALEVCLDCSKPCLDGYGGAAVFITKDDIVSEDTTAWLNRQEVKWRTQRLRRKNAADAKARKARKKS